MTKTTNYQLNQWEKTDRIQMERFNEDNAAVDAALKALDTKINAQTESLTALAAALALRGNCQMVTGSYKGTADYGTESSRTLSFQSKPLLVFIHEETPSGTANRRMVLVRDAKWSWMFPNSGKRNTVTWGEKNVTWSSADSHENANCSGTVYRYVALLDLGA